MLLKTYRVEGLKHDRPVEPSQNALAHALPHSFCTGYTLVKCRPSKVIFIQLWEFRFLVLCLGDSCLEGREGGLGLGFVRRDQGFKETEGGCLGWIEFLLGFFSYASGMSVRERIMDLEVGNEDRLEIRLGELTCSYAQSYDIGVDLWTNIKTRNLERALRRRG